MGGESAVADICCIAIAVLLLLYCCIAEVILLYCYCCSAIAVVLLLLCGSGGEAGTVSSRPFVISDEVTDQMISRWF